MVVELKRGIWGPFEGNIYVLPNGMWMYIDTDGEPIFIAATLEELWGHLIENGFVDFNQVKSFLITGGRDYYAHWGNPQLRAREEEIPELKKVPPEKVLMIQHEPDEPSITLDRIPHSLLPKILTGEIPLEEVIQ
ncbi:MAG: hypothetical protein QXJ64_08960 [Thermosphaera sp.]